MSALPLEPLPTTTPGPLTVPARRPRKRRALKVVQSPQPASHRAAITAGIGTLLVFGAIVGIVTLNALAAEASFQARELEREISTLTLRHDDLVVNIARLESPERVREVANAQLGLVTPSQPGFLVLTGDELGDPDKPMFNLDAATATYPSAGLVAAGVLTETGE